MTRTASHLRFVRPSHRTAVRMSAAAAAFCVLGVSQVAFAADNPNCPPGSWFCADSGQGGGTTGGGAGGGSNLQPLPPASEPPPAAAAPPVVVYQPPPPTVVIAAPPREAPPPYVYRAPEWQRKNEWGMNLHLGGLAIGRGQAGDSGMGLIGAGLRFRPIPYIALEGDLDFAGGRDYNGFKRGETALSGNMFVFLNPKDRAQFYFVGGLTWSAAHAEDDRGGFATTRATYDYSYFGVSGGVGLEYRAAKHVALNLDGRLFVRGRVDKDATNHPEFTDATGQTTNASGGGLLTAGITFYF